MSTKTSTEPATLHQRLQALNPDSTTWAAYLNMNLAGYADQDPTPSHLDLLWCLDNDDTEGLAQHQAAAQLAGPARAWNIAKARLEQRRAQILRTLDHAADNTPDPAAGLLAALETHLPDLAAVEQQLNALPAARPITTPGDPSTRYQPLRDGLAIRAQRIGAWAEKELLHRFHAFEAGLEPNPLPADWTVALLVAAWRYSRRSNRYLDTALNPQSATIS